MQLIDYADLGKRLLQPTGWKEITTINNQPHTSYPYYYTPVGNKFLLVKTENRAPGPQLIGNLYRIPADVQRDVIGGLEAKNPLFRGRFLPVMLDAAAAFKVFGYVFLGLFGPTAYFCVWNIAAAALRRSPGPSGIQ